MVVNPLLPVSVTIQADQTEVCQGQGVAFTATPVNGGQNPLSQWKVNGVNAGTNSSSFAYTPQNGDVVTVVLTSDANCATGNPATSNSVAMVVNPLLPVSVIIQADQTEVCQGQGVAFTATPVNGGQNPSYQWKVNGVNAGTNTSTFAYTPQNGDLVTVVLTSDANCAQGNPAISNSVEISVNENPVVTWVWDYDQVFDNIESLLLTGGSPVGGIYSGPGVDDNLFIPSVAGAGSHTLFYTYTNPQGCSSTAEWTITVEVYTGMNGALTFENIKVFPNPVRDRLFIDLGEHNEGFIQMIVFDVFGKVALVVEEANSSVYSIDVSSLSQGVYFLNVRGKKGYASFRFVVI
jgi:hypothetical protein